MPTVSQEFENILTKYAKHKLDTYKVLELLGTDNVFNDFGEDTANKRYTAMLECGTYLEFAKCVTQSNDTIYRLKASNFCRQRLCPMCQFRRSEKLYAQSIEVVKQLEAEGFRFLHIVLTIPNAATAEELAKAVKILYKGFGILWGYKEAKKAFKGALRCLEVSYNYENDTFHPHLHCLVAVRKSYFNDSRAYISYEKLQELWSKAVAAALHKLGFEYKHITKNTPPLQVHIGAVKSGDYSGVAEVCKYCVKPLDLSKGNEEAARRLLLTLFYTLKGTRFLQKYGVLKDKFRELYGDDEEAEAGEKKESELKRLALSWRSAILGYEVV